MSVVTMRRCEEVPHDSWLHYLCAATTDMLYKLLVLSDQTVLGHSLRVTASWGAPLRTTCIQELVFPVCSHIACKNAEVR